MKDIIKGLRELSLKIENSDFQLEFDSLITGIDTEYQNLLTRIKLVTKLSVGRKLKLADLYLRVSLIDLLKTTINAQLQLLGKLRQYQLAAVQDKKRYNLKLKVYFQAKLANDQTKDYLKFRAIATQFDFLSDDLDILDNNRKTYLLLLIAGVFGQDKLLGANLPKTKITLPELKKESRWNKTK